jgi:hypothetical protein
MPGLGVNELPNFHKLAQFRLTSGSRIHARKSRLIARGDLMDRIGSTKLSILKDTMNPRISGHLKILSLLL